MVLIKLDELFAKMGEYTQMEEELAFDEFVSYYDDLMACLQRDYQELSEDELVQAKGVTAIVASNAQMRATRKDANRKKFAKMGEKAAFWDDAISRRLLKSGMSRDTLDEKVRQLWN